MKEYICGPSFFAESLEGARKQIEEKGGIEKVIESSENNYCTSATTIRPSALIILVLITFSLTALTVNFFKERQFKSRLKPSVYEEDI